MISTSGFATLPKPQFSVLNSMMEQVKQENESDHSDVVPENSVPVIISGLRDQCVKLASPFSLSVTVENADTVTWMLEQQVIEAEPEEGLVLRQSGKGGIPSRSTLGTIKCCRIS